MPMAATRKSLSKKLKDGVRNGTASVQFAISNNGITIDTIRCSACNRIPDQEIFFCLVNHLICDICKQTGSCSREDCNQDLTAAEKLLAGITLQCPWTEFGCNEASLQRNDLTLHMKSCEQNPNFLSCSTLFHIECDFKFCTVSADDEDGIKKMKEHITSHEQELSVSDTIYASETKTDEFIIGELDNSTYVTEVLDWKLYEKARGTFMIVWLAGVDKNKMKTISRYFVNLAENFDFKVEVEMKIKSQPKPGRDITGNKIPDLKWHTIILNTREFQEILSLTTEERKLNNYSMQVSHLQDYYVNENDEVNVEFCLASADRKVKRRRT